MSKDALEGTRHRWLIVIFFCLFAGLIPETIFTTSTSPLKILLGPINLALIALFYGTADLVIREIMVRRKVGLASILLLGAAFGFVNEGVVAGTWYTVRPQGFMFIGGIDWTWVIVLTTFHTLVSVVMPIAFIEIAFPSVRGKSLLRRRGITIATILFLIFSTGVVAASNHAVPQLLPIRVAVLGIAIVMSLIALVLPARRPAIPETGAVPGQWKLRAAGFGAMLAFFFAAYLLPVLVAKALKSVSGGLLVAQMVDWAVLIPCVWLVIRLGWSWSRRTGWSPRENLALIVGALVFTAVILNLFQWQVGALFSTLPFLALLIVYTFRWSRRPPSYEVGL